MKIRVVKPDARIWGLLEPDTYIEIDLTEFWKQHEIDDKEYFLEQFIKNKLGVKHG
jgi:hypothetical protein